MTLFTFLAALMGCAAETPDSGALVAYTYMPLTSGVYKWEFIALLPDGESADQEFHMVGANRQNGTPVYDPDAGYQRYPVQYFKDCFQESETCIDGEEVMSFSWSSNASFGVEIWEFEDSFGSHTFEPALDVLPARFDIGEVTVTQSGGVTFTSTIVAKEPCPTRAFAGDNTPDCLRVELDDGGADTGLNGTIWMMSGLGVVNFDFDAEDFQWSLLETELPE